MPTYFTIAIPKRSTEELLNISSLWPITIFNSNTAQDPKIEQMPYHTGLITIKGKKTTPRLLPYPLTFLKKRSN
jgi:hypothetical protein